MMKNIGRKDHIAAFQKKMNTKRPLVNSSGTILYDGNYIADVEKLNTEESIVKSFL